MTWSEAPVSPSVAKKFWFLWVPWHAGGTFPPKFLGHRGGRSTLQSPPHLDVDGLGSSGKESGFFLLRSLALFGAMVGAADGDLVRLDG